MSLFDLIAERFRELPSPGPDPGPADPCGDSRAGELPRRLWLKALLDPAAQVIGRPGKGVRGRLLEAAWTAAGGAPGGIPPELPAVVELIHAGSLVIDDIEDGSDERRGGPTLHRQVGTALALNTGNWLVFWPLHLLGQIDLPADTAARAYRLVSAALVRCHQGQALDLALPITEIARRDLPQVVALSTRLRTASLTELAASLGALTAGAPPPRVAALGEFGRDLGIALQMLDDLGGLLSPPRRQKGDEDLRLGRPTWPWAWAAETAAPADLAWLLTEAARVQRGETDTTELRDRLARVVTEVGRDRCRAALEGARGRLHGQLPASPARDALTAELDLLERSYG